MKQTAIKRKAPMKRSPFRSKKRMSQNAGIRSTRCEGRLFQKIKGQSFASLLERAVAESLCAREVNKEISELKFQCRVLLTRALVSWNIDFSYMEDGVLWHHEAKGREMEPYQTKLKLYRVYGPTPLRISRGSAANHKITDTIYPRDWVKDA